MINLLDVKAGTVVYLKDGRSGTVVENMGDGQWLEVRFPEQADDDEPELIHSQDIADIPDGEG